MSDQEQDCTSMAPQPGPEHDRLKPFEGTLKDDDHRLMEMYFVKGGQEFKGMEIEYTRS